MNDLARGLAPPRRVSPEDILYFDVEVLAVYPVKPITNNLSLDAAGGGGGGDKDNATAAATSTSTTIPPWRLGRKPRVTKRVLREGQGWENPRPPFDVVVEVTAAARSSSHSFGMLIRSSVRGALD